MTSQMMMANALQGGAGVMPNPTQTGAGYQVGEQGYFDPMQQFSLGNYGQPQQLGEGIISQDALTSAMTTPEPAAPTQAPAPAPAPYVPPPATAVETRPPPAMVAEDEISPEWNEWMVEQVAVGNPMTSYNPEIAAVDPRLAEELYNQKQQQRGTIEDSWGQETQAETRDAIASVKPADIPTGLNQAQVARNRMEGFPDGFSLVDYIAANPGVNERTVFDHARANQGAAPAPTPTPAPVAAAPTPAPVAAPAAAAPTPVAAPKAPQGIPDINSPEFKAMIQQRIADSLRGRGGFGGMRL